MAGGVLAFTHEPSEVHPRRFRQAQEWTIRSEARKRLESMHGATEVDQFAFDTEILCHGAFLFTNVWLDDALDRALNPGLPKM